mmetsp:Transcript_5461/g.15651  ORF Transcript_5461/g.15651 Transcript_5461/m.15651 type:complete len:224 (+) Transcript_5461:61-732(+)
MLWRGNRESSNKASGERGTGVCRAALESTRCLRVGRPWGQFHGCCKVPRFDSTRSISCTLSAFPIMIALRHARQAMSCHTLAGRGTAVALHRARCPDRSRSPVLADVSCMLAVQESASDSSMEWRRSRMSGSPKTMPLHVGSAVTRIRRPGGRSTSFTMSKPFSRNISKFESTSCSWAGVSVRACGVTRGWRSIRESRFKPSNRNFSSEACWSTMKSWRLWPA